MLSGILLRKLQVSSAHFTRPGTQGLASEVHGSQRGRLGRMRDLMGSRLIRINSRKELVHSL